MLVIPEVTKEYFEEVRKEAEERRLLDKFNEAMMYAHLWGSSWVEPELCRFVLYKDFAPLSFVFHIERRKEDGSYVKVLNGGLIYEGPDSPANGQAPSFSVTIGEPRVGWFTHT